MHEGGVRIARAALAGVKDAETDARATRESE
jgi:hypothetical protein